jgi:O-antigen ligase
MKNHIVKVALWFSVFTLALELPVANIAGQSLKLWMFSALVAALILLWDVYKDGFAEIKQSKIFLFGLGFILFSLLGLIYSPRVEYSLKQIAVLAVLITLGILFEVYGKKKFKIIYSALAASLLVSAIAALYQNIAFEVGWPHFEVMAARPNAFFPEADWLGLFLALGLVPFLVWIGKDRQKSKLPKILHNKILFYSFLLLTLTTLTITVARASWLALIAEIGVIIALTTYLPRRQAGNSRLTTRNYEQKNLSRQSSVVSRQFLKVTLTFFSLIVFSLILINLFHLSRFDIPDRFRSIFFREHVITVAQNPATGENFKINLEEIEKYRAEGYLIKENYITDENVASREEKVASTWDIIKNHPFLGSGLGITLINTNYQHNANNLFLEWWASAGLGGILLITSFLVYLVVKGFGLIKKDLMSAQIVLAGTAGFIVVNLFNASILLAFAWFYLAILLADTEHKTQNA